MNPAGVTTFGGNTTTDAPEPPEPTEATVHNKESIIQSMIIESQGVLTHEQAAIAYKAVFSAILEKLEDGDEVLVTGFAKFFSKVRLPRMATHPGTGEKIEVPAKKVPGFKAGLNYRKAVALPGQKLR